jgi:tripartite-type tricarboxylate transporter receptor subunit TctC
MAERSPSLPEVPTYKESGIPIALDQWLGAFVPTGTPQAIVDRLNAEMNKALKEPAIRDLFVKSAQDVVGGTPAQFAKLVHDDFDKYARLTKELNIKVD